jgi:predicted DCC family thiol-disulfide oxidoreductase YuxK
MGSEKKIVVFDGDCNFCNRFVNFLIARDSREIFLFANSNSESGRKLKNEFSVSTIESVIFIENERAYVYSTAVLRILKNLGFPWSLIFIFSFIPSTVRDCVYKLFANNRHKLFTKSCVLATPEFKKRFLS